MSGMRRHSYLGWFLAGTMSARVWDFMLGEASAAKAAAAVLTFIVMVGVIWLLANFRITKRDA